MKTISRMTASAAALYALSLLAMTAPAAAGEFCMTDSSGMRGCGYATMDQCHASAAGKNGTCDRDPYFAAATTTPRNALAYSPKVRSARHSVAH